MLSDGDGVAEVANGIFSNGLVFGLAKDDTDAGLVAGFAHLLINGGNQ